MIEDATEAQPCEEETRRAETMRPEPSRGPKDDPYCAQGRPSRASAEHACRGSAAPHAARPVCRGGRDRSRRIRARFMGDIVDGGLWVRPFRVMEWSNEAALALIEAYRRHPVLWDARNQAYFSKSRKQEAWEAIAAGMQLDVQEIRQKMNSLLGSFRREKSRIKRNRDTFSGSNYNTKWFAFEKMQFLLREDETDITGLKFEEEEEDSFFEELKYPVQESSEAVPGEKRAPGLLNTTAPPLKRAKKLVKPPSDPVLNDIQIFQPQDEYSAFGQYLACKLRKFDSRTRAFIEHAINNVLFEADLGKYGNLSSPSGTTQQNWDVNLSNANQMSSDSPLNDIGDSS